jgi:heat shock protein HtpX
MPLTFIDIEKKKTWRISVLFIFLLFLYFCTTFALVQGFLLIIPYTIFLINPIFVLTQPKYLLAILAISFTLALIHFWFSAFRAVRIVLDHINASPPDPEDGLHRRLMDIMDEIHIVTGNKRQIKCVVIPSLSMNALAVADLKGEAVIAITEGLVSRLDRAQLESVIGHEAYHILSGDCLETSIAASLFGMYASALEKITDSGEEGPAGFLPSFLLFWILFKLSNLLSLFISREREYRADAASIRMTRNPLAMAEALYIISRNWTGIGFISRGLEMLCIVNPQISFMDESEGRWADLISTHPPIRKRIGILLKMARVSISEMEKKVDIKTGVSVQETPGALYYALDKKHQWQGPYTYEEIATLSWLTPRTWVSSGNEQNITKASENKLLSTIFTNRLNLKGIEITGFICPHCKQPLSDVSYEKTKVHQCNFCGGILVENVKIPRILARTEKHFTDRVKSLAKAVIMDNQRSIAIKRLKGVDVKTKPFILCPKCKNPMFRKFYSLAYLIEIDRCGVCNITWFDKDELEMLQYIIENKITPKIELQLD